jgi:phosphoserine phosphatase
MGKSGGALTIRLVAFDMEGVLTADPTVWEIMHRKLGTWDSHGQPYWDRYRAGEFGYDDFARMDVAVWRGAPVDLLASAVQEVALTKGCSRVLGGLRDAGMHLAIISNGLTCLANRFRKDSYVTHIFANEAISRDGHLTGEVDIRVPYASKGAVLCSLIAELGLRREQVAAVGDSSSDIAMFREARIGIAFRPFHPEVAQAATHHLPDDDLRPILDIVLA